jgi:hypothetical protein
MVSVYLQLQNRNFSLCTVMREMLSIRRREGEKGNATEEEEEEEEEVEE